MSVDEISVRLPRHPTGLPGFDEISNGGLPWASATLVVGTAGSGKTVFGLQFLAEGIRKFGESGVFVTFGEPTEKLRRFVVEFGWDLAGWERDGRWLFVDATTGIEEAALVVGDHPDLTVLLDRIAAAIGRSGAKRVALDSLQVLLARFGDTTGVRDALLRIIASLEHLGVTAVVTTGRAVEDDVLTAANVEDYLADNVVILRNTSVDESRRRTIEILKFRGTAHRRGQFPLAITRAKAMAVIPLSIDLNQPSGTVRISTGLPDLDAMCGGGLFQDSVTLVSGSTGAGKTSVAMQFALAGARDGHPAVVVAFEESREQLLRGIAHWGYDVPALEAAGRLRFIVDYPEVRTYEEHLIRLQETAAAIGARRVVVDSLTSLRRSGPERSFREFAIGLTAYLKQHEIAGVITTAQTSVIGADVGASEEHVSALADAIIMLRYVEIYGELRRGITVLKLRGSGHEKGIREYAVAPEGVRIGAVLRTTTGIMSARPSQLDTAESARVAGSFADDRAERSS